MGRPKRDIRATAEEATTPPYQLTETQSLAKVIKAEGNSLYACSLPNQQTVLVELASRFRNTVWIRRGGYVLVQLISSEEEKGRVEGEIINVVGDEKQWRKQTYWPKEFPRFTYEDEDEDSTTGKMPPLDSEDEH
ncbi:nucleic acid-binding protein [Annulohypoxylon maeteangense]|uniref:nucleic acid-binding protein n=1 Tax=Annulohypoxylon maeteangense TaxID=1927788 RepID=UPI002008E452|nr:nucleic acid-binding protein [Annulohypoxylon maeteangense]KAI0889107.1 nucleic acid-binding protein [Annulohypoxylon maeteangense]